MSEIKFLTIHSFRLVEGVTENISESQSNHIHGSDKIEKNENQSKTAKTEDTRSTSSFRKTTELASNMNKWVTKQDDFSKINENDDTTKISEMTPVTDIAINVNKWISKEDNLLKTQFKSAISLSVQTKREKSEDLWRTGGEWQLGTQSDCK